MHAYGNEKVKCNNFWRRIIIAGEVMSNVANTNLLVYIGMDI